MDLITVPAPLCPSSVSLAHRPLNPVFDEFIVTNETIIETLVLFHIFLTLSLFNAEEIF